MLLAATCRLIFYTLGQHQDIDKFISKWRVFSRSLFENALFPNLCVILKKLSSEYQLYACGNFFRKPCFW